MANFQSQIYYFNAAEHRVFGSSFIKSGFLYYYSGIKRYNIRGFEEYGYYREVLN
jgi:hypothetical protein